VDRKYAKEGKPAQPDKENSTNVLFLEAAPVLFKSPNPENR
jgi:hypothetical protein